MWVNKMFLMDYKHKLKANIMLIGKKEINKKNHVLETMFKMLKVELLQEMKEEVLSKQALKIKKKLRCLDKRNNN